MSELFQFKCPFCEQEMEVPPEAEGQVGKCPSCNEEIIPTKTKSQTTTLEAENSMHGASEVSSSSPKQLKIGINRKRSYMKPDNYTKIVLTIIAIFLGILIIEVFAFCKTTQFKYKYKYSFFKDGGVANMNDLGQNGWKIINARRCRDNNEEWGYEYLLMK